MLSLVIPFYNDAGCPTKFVKELKKELKGIDYELILVDDCSTDSTPEELDGLKNKKIHIIHNKQNKDYGGAIQTGLNQAKGEIIGWTCGDGEVSAKDVIGVYKEMKDSDDIIKADRINRQDGVNRKYISKVLNIWSRLRFRSTIGKLKDINGYPAYFKNKDYKKISNIRTDWIFNTDLFRKMSANGCKIREYPVVHEKRSAGQSHMNPMRIVKMIIKYVFYK